MTPHSSQVHFSRAYGTRIMLSAYPPPKCPRAIGTIAFSGNSALLPASNQVKKTAALLCSAP